MPRLEPLTEDDVDRIARRVLDQFVNTQAGVPGLRRLGNGARDAVTAGDVPPLMQVFGQRPALLSSAPTTSLSELRALLPHPSLPEDRLSLMEVRALGGHPPLPVPAPDDAQVVLAGRIFGNR